MQRVIQIILAGAAFVKGDFGARSFFAAVAQRLRPEEDAGRDRRGIFL